jgi:succinoglycan biosynthesis protein ExoV
LAPNFLDNNDEEIFLGIGTLINKNVPMYCKKLVFGSGVGYGNAPVIDNKWQIPCVRGPLTADTLGLDYERAITDAAGLVPLALIEHRHTINSSMSFMPHHKTARLINWAEICSFTNIHYIDPSKNVEQVIRDILSTDILITEALHGAVVADALRIPWIPVIFFNYIYEFKWWDWCKSLNLMYEPIKFNWHQDRLSHIRNSDAQKYLLKASKHKPFLSSREQKAVYERLESKFTEVISQKLLK